MAEFIVCFGSDDEKNGENESKKTKTKPSYKSEDQRLPRKNTKQKKKENDKDKLEREHKEKEKLEKELIEKDIKDIYPIIDINVDKLELVEKQYSKEKYYGNVEYKLMLKNITLDRLDHLVTQMKFRLQEGNGECYYIIGVEDNGNALGIGEEELKNSIETLCIMTQKIDAEMSILQYTKGKEGLIAEIMIKLKKEVQEKKEIKIGMIGEENSGKSTLVGCLVSGNKDNGKGSARKDVFRHIHELFCGKTSSLSHQIVGFDEEGKITNYDKFGKQSWGQIVEKSVKILNFYDMGGSEKAFKTTNKALSANYLDYVFLVISADNGITNNTKMFLKLALEMNLPIITIITKIDLINEYDIYDLLDNFNFILKSLKKGKNPLIAKNKDDIVTFSRNLSEGILPIFLISNKTGKGLDLFINFLNLLPENNNDLNELNITKFDILEIFEKVLTRKDSIDIRNNNLSRKNSLDNRKSSTEKKESQMIIAGIVNKGILCKGLQYKIGPDSNGNFRSVTLENIHCKRIEVKTASKGQFCSLLLDPSITKDMIRKGMVMLDFNTNPTVCRLFEVEVWSMDDNIKIKYTAQPLINVSHIRQSVRIKKLDNNEEEEFIVYNDKTTKILFEFMYQPEYITEGSHLIINENNIKLYGYVTKIIN